MISSMNNDLAIEVSNVSKTFEIHADRRSTLKERFVKGRSKKHSDFHALDDVSFTVRKGTTFGIIGHNGSGKSTMLKILAGVYRPTSGSVAVASKVDALLELGAGFHGELTGRENIYLNGAILGRSRKEIEDSIDWIIDYADIGEFIDEPVKVYSSGMTVRLGFAVAVAVKPEILIVDEIIAVGDEEFQRKCFDLMRDLRSNGATTVLVTHSLSLAQEMCDDVIWLDHGQVRQEGEASDVVSAYIAHVNEIENTKRAAELEARGVPEGEDPDEYRLNQGNGDCRMTSVEYLDEDGKHVPFLTADRPGTVRVHVRSFARLDNVELGLAFVTDGGVTVAGPNSKHAGALYSLDPGDAFIDYTMPTVMLQPGHYWLTTAFVRDGEMFDYSDRRTELTVRGARIPDEPGLVQLPMGRWSHRPHIVERRAEER
jgi:ABC-2 type transport system ATP-binding protein/lipopolysaccharide transport system ATP-binding protein